MDILQKEPYPWLCGKTKDGGWEDLAEFEVWLINQMSRNDREYITELYDDIPVTIQQRLYIIFCDLFLHGVEQYFDKKEE